MNKNKLNCDIIMLPAEIGGVINKNLNTNALIFKKDIIWNKTTTNTGLQHRQPQHLYLVSNRRIKDNDWALLPNNTIKKMNSVDILDYLNSESVATRKIESTTDPLLHDNIPKIPQSFTKFYAENDHIKTIDVEIEVDRAMSLIGKAFRDGNFHLKTCENNTAIIIN